jgi:hypothetical protein
MVDTSQHGNGPSGSIQGEEFLPRHYQLLKDDSDAVN